MSNPDGPLHAAGLLPSEEYLAGYRAGFEDGKALGDVFTSSPFVIVYIDRQDPEMYRYSWRHINNTDQAEMLVLGLDEVLEEIEGHIDDSLDEDDDDQ